MDRSDSNLQDPNQAESNNITTIKHRRHLAPKEDTKSHIFGDTASSANAAAPNATKDASPSARRS